MEQANKNIYYIRAFSFYLYDVNIQKLKLWQTMMSIFLANFLNLF